MILNRGRRKKAKAAIVEAYPDSAFAVLIHGGGLVAGESFPLVDVTMSRGGG